MSVKPKEMQDRPLKPNKNISCTVGEWEGKIGQLKQTEVALAENA